MGRSDRGMPARPSLHATFRLALLVQQVRRSLKAKVKQHRSQTAALTARESRNSARDAFSRLERDLILENAGSRTSTRRQKLQGQPIKVHPKQNIPKLLDDLKSCSSPADGRSGLVLRQKDGVFLRDVQAFARDTTLQNLSSILDITTCLLSRLKTTRATVIELQKEGASWKDHDSLKVEKFTVYLEGLLRCLQEASLRALICHSLEVVEADIAYWCRYSEQQKRLNDAWFTEWPGRRRPLSTTWPWNVKPSLMVLWGVCWMFYGKNDDRPPQAASGVTPNATYEWVQAPQQRLSVNHPRPAVNQRSRRPSHEWRDWGRQPNIPAHPMLVSHAASLSEVSRPGNPTGAFACANAASPNDDSNFPFQSLYISSESTPYQLASTPGWPDIPGLNASFQGYGSAFSHRQPALDDVQISPHTSRADQSLQLITHVGVQNEVQNPLYLSPNYIPPTAFPNYNSSSPMQSSQDYPSPSSNGSVRASSTGPSHHLNSVSPKTMSTRLGSIESGSPTGNRRPSSDAQEPARDAGGQIICTHPKCAKQPPVFQRKCEWTKHMDKHNRPYVCQEPGCDKIQGFTYSGGLLRHQREVHKQHGGPKTRYMCPFQDCKRSSGQGFSRKENLNEHLRRVHRGAGIKRNEPGSGEKADDGANDGTVLGGRSSGAAEGKKRRRVEVDDDESDDGAEDGLMREVRRLRKEVRDKDEQISDLQERMRRLEESLMGQPAFV